MKNRAIDIGIMIQNMNCTCSSGLLYHTILSHCNVVAALLWAVRLRNHCLAVAAAAAVAGVLVAPLAAAESQAKRVFPHSLYMHLFVHACNASDNND